ncbi:hypothetical protein BCR44DRAFT_44926 [Catenaria anguillulae PL171]|uniref:Uncharacterized protein n=1 Tax=Catenaria anguillulae PL171 TaxID=765915 RepID=A0A1Y2HLE0_9FUNG|nr:hypothetical protein BCR44DRAFT_44926 [Catenaria anguillulae PL171]
MPPLLSAFLGRPSLASSLAVSFGVQTAAYLYSTLGRPVPTEHYYDLSGSLTHLAIISHALATSALNSPTGLPPARVALLGALSATWAIRLGTYLYARVQRVGKDDRFDELKKDPVRWLTPWVFQALWCFMIQAPVTIAATASVRAGVAAAGLTRWDYLGASVFLGGLAWEITADRQKDAFKRTRPSEPFTGGLFKYSVYANYFGECSLWWGAYLMSVPAISAMGSSVTWLHAVSLTSPLFTAFLLHRVSGIPLLEKSAWKKYGGDQKWLEYRARTSVFWPWVPKSGAVSKAEVEEMKRKAVAKWKVE